MATIKKRETKTGRIRWDAQVYVGREDGRPKFLSKTFEREKDAKAWARKQEGLKDGGKRPPTTKETLGEWLRHWLKIKAGKVTARTAKDYEDISRRWVFDPPEDIPIRLGPIQLRKLTLEQFETLYAWMRDQGLSPRTIQYVHVVLRTALKEATKRDKILRNPTDDLSPPTRPKDADEEGGGEEEEDVVPSLSKEEADRFLLAARSDRLSALWHILLTGGLRPSEAYGLKWVEVDFEEGRIRVQRSLTRIGKRWKLTGVKTKGSRRTVPLPPVTMGELRKWKVAQAKERLALGPGWKDRKGLVFTTPLGTPLHHGNIHRGPFRRIMRDAGLVEWGPEPRKPARGPTPERTCRPLFRIYDLRHTCATLLLMKGVSLKVVSERLGHARSTFTADTYGHVLPTMQEAASSAMQEMFGT